MTIEEKIHTFHQHFWCALPSFYVRFLVHENLEDSKPFNPLTVLYGVNDLASRQDGMQQYLPGFIKIGDDSGGYGVFIRVGAAPGQTAQDTAIYITSLGDMDETSLEKLAEDFREWAKKEFDTEIFLDNLYHKQMQFKYAQINAPILDLKEKISTLNKQLNTISHQKSKGKLDLKSYLLQKKEMEQKKESLNKQLIEHESELLKATTHYTSRAQSFINARVIENTFDIKLPVLYKKLADDGMLEYADAFGSDWYEKVFPSLKTQPPFLLFAKNFELMSLRNVYEELREQRDGLNASSKDYPYDHWIDGFFMVPFAGDGSGDRYAFYWPNTDTEPQIIHWWHDSDHCDIKAKNLQDFIFISLLDCAMDSVVDNDIAANGDIKNNLNNMLDTHERYLTASQYQTLKNVYARDVVQDFEEDTVSFININEYQKILLQEIGYHGDLGSFKYSK